MSAVANLKFKNEKQADMEKRPYFKLGIDALGALYQQNKGDEALLKSLAAELVHRDRPKAKALQRQVAQRLAALSSGGSQPIKPPPPVQPPVTPPPPPPVSEQSEYPSRISVECGKCGTVNFISTLESVTQHLSCCSCKTNYEAVFKYGVLRTKFDTSPVKPTSYSPTVILVVLIAIIVIIGLFATK
ncbi:MAG: hypothetical protein LBE51_00595 [Acidovorax sp.]|jgi:hypothetical protein|nr:hypothetical protein [Acidovorax sp.]